MKRVQTAGRRTKTGPHYFYAVSDKDIAEAANVNQGTVVVARMRGKFKTFLSIIRWINLQRLMKKV
jgi:hypothetical protein